MRSQRTRKETADKQLRRTISDRARVLRVGKIRASQRLIGLPRWPREGKQLA
jgi:hypothetical protein